MNEFTAAPDNDAPPIKPLGMAVFLAVALGLPLWYTWSMFNSGIVIDLKAMAEDPEATMAIIIPLMIFGATQAVGPAVAALLARLIGREGFGEGNFRWMPGKLFWQLFLGLPLLVWLAFLLTAITGMGTIDSSVFATMEGKQLGGMIATVLVAPLLAMVASIPSEWGWRAYFYSRMAGRFGARAGALWAAIPVAALGVVAVKVTVPQGGISESQAMVAAALGAGLFSIIASYFYRRRKSIWAAALATGAIAAHANGVLTTIVTDPEPWIGAPSGAIFFGVFGVVAWKLWHADWTPVDDSTPVMEMEAAYEIPDGPAVPEPMESAPPEKTEEEPDDSPGGAG